MSHPECEYLQQIYSQPGFEALRAYRGVRVFSAPGPGMDLVMAGYIGLAGTVWMARHKEKELLRTLPWDYVDSGRALLEYIAKVPEAAVAGQHGAAAMHFVTEGGIFGGLWELAQAMGTGLCTRLEDIPVRQQTIEFCEVFDLNPYQLLAGGCAVLAVERSGAVMEALRQKGIPCALIGRTTADHDRVVLHDDIRRYLTRPQRDEIYKLLEV